MTVTPQLAPQLALRRASGLLPRLHASNTSLLRWATCVFVACGLLTLAGCKSAGKNVSRLDDGAIKLKGNPPRGAVPSYETLAKRYNQRVADIPQFASQAQIEIIYHDRKGKRHFEQADQGRVIMLLPDHMAVLVRKFGVGDLFLAGSNAEHYWLFDLTDGDHRVLYQGSKAQGATTGFAQLPVPVQPRDLPALMGLESLPLGEGEQAGGEVTAVAGGYLVSPAGKSWRVVVDAKTSLPLRVDLMHKVVVFPEGESVSTATAERLVVQRRVYMTALLSSPVKLETQGKGATNWPTLMKRIELRPHDSGDYLVVHLSAAANDGDLTADNRAFDLERLKRTYKPDELVDMDKQASDQ